MVTVTFALSITTYETFANSKMPKTLTWKWRSSWKRRRTGVMLYDDKCFNHYWWILSDFFSHTCTLAHTCARTHARTHARTSAHTHTHIHTHSYIHTHTQTHSEKDGCQLMNKNLKNKLPIKCKSRFAFLCIFFSSLFWNLLDFQLYSGPYRVFNVCV